MPNWKKIALSGSNPEFSSINVDNSVNASSLTGSLDFSNLTNTPTLLSSSAQIASDITGSFTLTSASIASDIVSLITDSGSFSTRVTAIEGFSSSIESSIYSYTGSFTGDGSGLTGVQTELTEQVTLVDSFTLATTHSVSHTFETKNLNVTLYDENDDIFIPSRINTPNTSSVVVYMDPPTSGRVVISKGGHIVSGSIVTELVETQTVSDTFTSANTHSVSHTFGTKDVFVTVYDDNDEQFIPSKIITPTTSSVIVHMDPATSGRVVVAKGGHFVSGSVQGAGTDLSAVDEHILPATNNTYDLGSPTKQFRDLYLSDASLYVDGVQVLSSTADTLTFTTDTGQSIKLLEDGADDIILQTDTGNIELKGTVEILTGKKITDSAGSQVVFGDGIYVEGNITTTGTVDGIDLQAFSSSVATGFANTTADYNELTNIPVGIISSSAQIASDISGSFTSISASIASDIAGISTDWESITSKPAGIVSGSSQITTLLNGQDLTLNNLTVDGTQTIIDSTRLAIGDNIIELNAGGATNGGLLIKDVTAPNSVSGSLLWDSTNDYWMGGALGSESRLLRENGDNVISGSSQVDYNSIQNKPTIPTNNNELTNGAGYTTFTANQSVDTTSTVTFSTVTATSLTETSALRFKENIQEDIDSSIIDKLRPVSYDWKENKEKDYGFIAEEVNELDSTLTTENEDGEMLGIKYTKLIPFLVKKIQEQEERIKQLENGNS